MADDVIQQNDKQVGDDMVLPEQPDMSERFAAHDRLKKIWEDEMNTFKPKSKEELDAERKRFNRNKIVSAVGDGISAIANLVSAANYAPNMYNNENSLSSKMQARYDKATADYEAKKTQYMNAASNWGKIVDTDADIKYQQWADKVKNVLAQAKEKRERDNAAANLKLTGAQADYWTNRADKAGVEADTASQEAQDKHNLSVARQGQANASAAASSANANLSNTKAANSSKSFCGQTYSDDSEYKRIVYSLATKYNVPTKETVTVKGRSTQKERPIAQVAAEVEAKHTAAEKEKNSYKRK
jgi:hypothetical protein